MKETVSNSRAATLATLAWIAFGVSAVLAVGAWLEMYGLISSTDKKHERIAVHLQQTQAIADAIALVQQLNSPGNDVLESWNFVAERKKFAVYRGTFDAHDREMENLFGYSADLMSVYEAFRTDVREMIKHANAVFAAAEHKVAAEAKGELVGAQAASNHAAARMAMMDQSFARATKALRDMELEQRNGIRDVMSASSSDKTRVVSTSLFSIALAVVLGLIAVTLLRRAIAVHDDGGLDVAPEEVRPEPRAGLRPKVPVEREKVPPRRDSSLALPASSGA